MSRFQIFIKGAGYALPVQALVLKKSCVFGGDKGLNGYLGNLGNLDQFSVFGKELVNQLIIIGVDPAGNAGTIVFQDNNARYFFQ